MHKFIPVWIMMTALASAESPSELIGNLQKHYEQIQSFSADFEQNFQGQGIFIRESGIVKMKKPGKMYWQYQQPNKKLFIADGKKSYFYVPNDNQVIITDLDLSDAPIPLLFLIGKGDLNKDFHADFEKEEEPVGVNNILLRLTPKGSQTVVSHVTLEIDRSTYLIHRLIVTESIGSRNEYILRNMLQNRSFPDRLFVFKIPDKAEVLYQ